MRDDQRKIEVMPVIMRDVGRRVRACRELRRLSIEQLAAISNRALSEIESLEGGTINEPEFGLIEAVSRGLDISILELLRDAPVTKSTTEEAAEKARAEKVFLEELSGTLKEFVFSNEVNPLALDIEVLRLLQYLAAANPNRSAADYRAIYQSLITVIKP